MTKKQTRQQILSPENYIRQRARNLPLSQCLINDGWDDSGLAYIIISREHINGNLTVCFYLVDLLCLGVKDTFFRFNISKWEYDEMIEKFTETISMSVVEYNLVHNIIFAALEFAEEIGFKPHKDFESITQYMLEEDDEKIPLIDIACGDENGRPYYIQGEIDSDAKARQILNHLDKEVGPNNYDYLLSDEMDEDFDDEGIDDKDFEDNYSEYLSNSFEENAKLFLEFTNFLDENELLNDDSFIPDATKLMVLIDVLKKDIVKKDLVDEWLKKWQEESEKIQIADLISRESLGLAPDQPFTEKDLNYLTTANKEKMLKYIRKKWGKIPFVLYYEIIDEKNKNKRAKKVKEYFDKYPDFPLLKAQFLMEQFKNKMIVPDETWLEFSEFFPFRETISYSEFYILELLRLCYFMSHNNLEGFISIMLSLDLYEGIPEDLLLAIEMFFIGGQLSLLRTAVLKKITSH